MSPEQKQARREVCRTAAALLRQLPASELWQHRPQPERLRLSEAKCELVQELERRGKEEVR